MVELYEMSDSLEFNIKLRTSAYYQANEKKKENEALLKTKVSEKEFKIIESFLN